MRKLIFAVALATLAGCARWDEAKERVACEKSHTDPSEVANCVKEAKERYDRGFLWAIFNHHP
jgi:hypothetical protein